ncbi:MAG: hypothetical protein ACI9JN_000708, partial [Bacteroidia bacterium]
TKPDSMYMRPELSHVCYGVFDGGYVIKGMEVGNFTNDVLQGRVEVLKAKNYGWNGTINYVDGKKHGIESCSNGRNIYQRQYVDGKKKSMKVFSKDQILLRHEVYGPIKRLYTYELNGKVQRIQVQDSVHLYYKNQVLRYSLTFNTQKKIWESRSLYPSGKMERYRPHSDYRYSPIGPNTWYDENGKEMSEPDPTVEVEEDMFYQSISALMQGSKSTYPKKEILQLSSATNAKNVIDSILLSTPFKIKKKYQGSYAYTFFQKSDGLDVVMRTAPNDDTTLPDFISSQLSDFTFDSTVLSNFKVIYVKAKAVVDVSR